MYIRKGYEETKDSKQENWVNLNAFIVFAVAVNKEDIRQLFSMELQFRWACFNFGCGYDASYFESAEDCYEKENVYRKALVLVKKLLWINDRCYKLTRYTFLRRQISLQNESDVFNMAFSFSRSLTEEMNG